MYQAEDEDNFSYVYDFTDTSKLILVNFGPVHSRVCGDISKKAMIVVAPKSIRLTYAIKIYFQLSLLLYRAFLITSEFFSTKNALFIKHIKC
jgi:hypothetical protein